jgi:cytidylate kinase
VLPEADLKLYLDASTEVRARRRHEELALEGQATSLRSVHEELLRRDAIDSRRKTSPLRPAADAIVIDTNDLTLEEVVERVLSLI